MLIRKAIFPHGKLEAKHCTAPVCVCILLSDVHFSTWVFTLTNNLICSCGHVFFLSITFQNASKHVCFLCLLTM